MNPDNDSVLGSFTRIFHFYFAQATGWVLFQVFIYPELYVGKMTDVDLCRAIPFYLLNVLAFGCLVYVATGPMVSPATYVISGLLERFTRR